MVMREQTYQPAAKRTPGKEGAAPSAAVFTRAVAEAFAEHARRVPLRRPVRGFNAVLRRKMDEHDSWCGPNAGLATWVDT